MSGAHWFARPSFANVAKETAIRLRDPALARTEHLPSRARDLRGGELGPGQDGAEEEVAGEEEGRPRLAGPWRPRRWEAEEHLREVMVLEGSAR